MAFFKKKKKRVLCCISKWFLLLSHCWRKHKGIFIRYLLWKSGQAPRGKSHKIGGGGSPMTGSPGVLNALTHWQWSSSKFSVAVQVFLLWHWFLRWFLLLSIWVSKLWFLYPVTCPAVCIESTTLMDPRRGVDSSVCSALYLLLWWSGDFQASYMWHWKLLS